MAKFIITKIGNKYHRSHKVVKERVELRILPLIGCFLLAVAIWMAVVGTQISEDEQHAAQVPSVNAETQSRPDLASPETAGQEVHEAPDSPAPENGLPPVSS